MFGINFNMAMVLIGTVIGGLYQVWLLLGFSCLTGIYIDLEKEFQDGSLFFYSIGLVIGLGITWFGLDDSRRPKTNQKINTILMCLGVGLVIVATLMYGWETLARRKFNDKMLDDSSYFICQIFIAGTAIVISIIGTLHYGKNASAAQPTDAATAPRHVTEAP
jgi:uncharacterized membrane protein YidH (DUF202 family)